MAKVHLTLQGKGGVGKSMMAAIIAQYKASKGRPVLCIDTDPVNATFEGYESLNVRRLEIMDGDEINSRNFDLLIEWIATEEADDIVIDNGASSFVPLSSYLIGNQVPDMLAEMGHQLIVHIAVTGGQAYEDTVNGFEAIVSQYPQTTLFVIWLNPYWGPVQSSAGIPFEKSPEYKATLKEAKGRIAGFVVVENLKKDTAGRDFGEMLQSHLTFDEALGMESLSIMTRQRLKLVKKGFYDQLDNLPEI
ncbi:MULTISPECIES: nucleotide-binding protein [Azotobacter]|uniref:Conjugal transfer protein TraL n=1 Tax=Azotobacter chroococcum NCIMB 8003 TaxID=1328314 RepID=A0A0C4WUE4_9GAMM|nr:MULTISPECIES: ArsA-related P-loop ATPase [Azotobacter]AJE23495.1 Conjugal transfer protein TraL [Azotobacter chroococcum NCIMB 8003]MDV7210080.1 ArsA-related P-loop ATPase [Azotobacter beijerinckii]